jgi:ubiquinone/menaquinone biosynthesis C-methylase UbiE
VSGPRAPDAGVTDAPRPPVSAERGHRWFASIYERRGRRGESPYEQELRGRVAGEATGRVLEIGAGTGLNFPHYPENAEVVATEPDPQMLRRAGPRASEHGVDLRAAPAEHLPFPDRSFDTVVSTGVFCSVDDPKRALGEVHRVLRPGGQLRFSEHVRAERPLRRIVQLTFDPIHRLVFRCHIGRDTLRTMRQAGFEIEDLERLRYADVMGVARRP